jgi:glycosyltransferase involved in cell wall biosynthesis
MIDSDYKGSSIFLKNLKIQLDNNLNIKPYKIIIPKKNFKLPNKGEKIIARFDGITHYKFTIISLYNFMKLRKLKFLPLLNTKILNSHKSSFIIDKLINKYLSRFDISLYKHLDLAVYQSIFSYQIHQFVLGINPKKKKIIYNGVNIPKKKTNTHSQNKYLNLVITAHFRLGKRLKEAIIICNRLNSVINAKLHIIGNLDLMTKKSIETIDLTNCNFYSQLNTNEIMNLYKEMHIGLSPSINEACSNSVLEMMSVGIPVIVSSLGGNKELMPSFFYVVNEKINDIAFFEYHNIYCQNELNSNNWVKRILEINKNLEYHSSLIYSHVKKKFDIKIIAKQYSKAINEL